MVPGSLAGRGSREEKRGESGQVDEERESSALPCMKRAHELQGLGYSCWVFKMETRLSSRRV